MTAYRELAWVGLGVVAWFALRIFSPRAAGYALLALVITALLMIAPSIAQLGANHA